MLTIKALTAGYGARIVLHDLNLRVEAGQIVAVIGPNGCGKSTLLRCAAGLLEPKSGRALLLDREIGSIPHRERARLIALLPQSAEAASELTAEQMVMLGRTPYLPPYGLPSADDRAVVDDCLSQVVATELANRSLNSLSGGELQRVLIARALAQQPQVLLLDEPVSHLDLRYQFEILALAHRLARQGLAIVVVLHQINLASALADHLVLLSESGTVQAAGPAALVLTEEHLRQVYRLPLTVGVNPATGRPHVQAAWTFVST